MLTSDPFAHEQRQCGTSKVRVEGTTCTLSDIHHRIVLNMYLRDALFYVKHFCNRVGGGGGGG